MLNQTAIYVFILLDVVYEETLLARVLAEIDYTEKVGVTWQTLHYAVYQF